MAMNKASASESFAQVPPAAIAPLEALSKAIQTVGRVVGESVVAVRIERPGPVASPAYRGESVVAGAGSGVVLGSDGLILTAAHVIALADRITVTTASGETHDAKVVGKDEPTDLALLKIAATGLRPIHTASPDSTAPGGVVIAVGRPPGFGIVLTAGVLSAPERTVRNSSGGLVENVLQACAPIGPGTSGGALADARGRLIGINTAAGESSSALSFAIPVETVEWVAEELARRGEVTRLNLGFTGETTRVSPEAAAVSNLASAYGVAVKSIGAESPAARAGLEVGDIVTRICDHPVSRLGELHRLLVKLAGEREIHVEAVRMGQPLEFMLMPQSEQDLSQRTA